MELWRLVRTQWRMGCFGAAGLDYPAVLTTAQLFGVKMHPRLMRGIQGLESFELKRMGEKISERGARG